MPRIIDKYFITLSDKSKVRIEIDGLNRNVVLKFNKYNRKSFIDMIINNRDQIDLALKSMSEMHVKNEISNIQIGKIFNRIEIEFRQGFIYYEPYAAIFYYLIGLEIEKNELFLADLLVSGSKGKFLIDKIVNDCMAEFLNGQKIIEYRR